MKGFQDGDDVAWQREQALRRRLTTVGTGFILVAVFAGIANLGLLFAGHLLRASQPPATPPPGMTPDQQKSWQRGRDSAPFLEFMCLGTVSLAVYLPVFIAGIMIQQGRGWGFGIAASILAMLPCSFGCLLGLPVGIWALTVLFNDEVKNNAFQNRRGAGGR